MKKILALCLVLVLALPLLASCGKEKGPDLTPVFEAITPLLKKEYNVDVATQVEKDGNVLTSTFKATKNDDGSYKIEYVIEKFAEFPLPEESSTIPKKEIVTESGTVTYQDGALTKPIRADVDISELSVRGFTFDPSYFADPYVAEGKFQAKVTNPSAFLGEDLGATDMNVNIIYNATALRKITLDYMKDGVKCSIHYEFS